jgi:hypothetical protein
MQISDCRFEIVRLVRSICNLKSAICNPLVTTSGWSAVANDAFAIAAAELLANPVRLLVGGTAGQLHLGIFRTGVTGTEIADVDHKEIFVHRLSHCVPLALAAGVQEAILRNSASSLFRYSCAHTTMGKERAAANAAVRCEIMGFIENLVEREPVAEPKRWTPWHGENWVPAESLPVMSRQVALSFGELLLSRKIFLHFAFAACSIRKAD